MQPIVNISTYKFAPLTGLPELRENLLAQCKAWGLKGTILLSPEGINMFVAGPEDQINLLIARVREVKGLEDLAPKVSKSAEQPFTRMLVRLKKEIITFGVEGIEPGKRTSPKLPAKELKKWLDEGRPVTLLDTRNDYEIELGTFKNAVPAGIRHFRKFPEAVRKLPERMKEETVVMFCTGGIRCEKAGPFMEREGFKNVYQLDGGILKYFEEVGGDHYEGECFVFDQRVGVDNSLKQTDYTLCFTCLTPLTPEHLKDPRYEQGETCPFCFKTDEEKLSERVASRQQRIREITKALPGKAPYFHAKPINIPKSQDKKTLIQILQDIFKHVPKENWENLIAEKRLVDEKNVVPELNRIVRSGERYFQLTPQMSEPDVNANIEVLYEDEAIVVVNKPAPLPVHPSGRFNRNTLQYILDEAYRPQRVRLGHRLDANTSGLMVLARTQHFARILQPQFARGEVEKKYLARVKGHPKEDSFSYSGAISGEAGATGSREVQENGLEATTLFKVLQRHEDGTSTLEVTPLTGRTNQIRVHLWALGFPICGDQTYLPNSQLGETQTASLEDNKMELYAYHLSFMHPLTKNRVEFKLPI